MFGTNGQTGSGPSRAAPSFSSFAGGRPTAAFASNVQIAPNGVLAVNSRKILGTCPYCSDIVIDNTLQFSTFQDPSKAPFPDIWRMMENSKQYLFLRDIALAILENPKNAVEPRGMLMEHLTKLHPNVGEIPVIPACKHPYHLKCIVANANQEQPQDRGDCAVTNYCLVVEEFGFEARPGIPNAGYAGGIDEQLGVYQEPLPMVPGRILPAPYVQPTPVLPATYAQAMEDVTGFYDKATLPGAAGGDYATVPANPSTVVLYDTASPGAIPLQPLNRTGTPPRLTTPSASSIEETGFGLDGKYNPYDLGNQSATSPVGSPNESFKGFPTTGSLTRYPTQRRPLSPLTQALAGPEVHINGNGGNTNV